MIARFCLYGFLKNQRYFEPFLVLVLLDRGLDFLAIGLLVAVRELVVNVLEVPSGAIADLWGRRRALMAAWVAYLVSFALFDQADSWTLLAVAMGLYGAGDAFRSGTHKAILFDWLASQGREGEASKVYGLTRSWSQLGSAVSVVIAAAIVLRDASYHRVFLVSMLPYGLGLLNFLGYPKEAPPRRGLSVGEVGRHLWAALKSCWKRPRLRRLLTESMLQRSVFTFNKDYLQPLLERVATSAPLALPVAVWLARHLGGSETGGASPGLDPIQSTAVLVGAVSFVLYLLSSVATRQAHRFEGLFGNPGRASQALWGLNLGLFGVLVVTLGGGVGSPFDGGSPLGVGLTLAAFVGVALVHNLWKPLFLARIDTASDAALGATILSIDSQTKALFVMVAAPSLGWAVDHWGLVAVGWFGLALGIVGLATVRTDPDPQSQDA